jgi:DNA polymerase
MSETGEEREPAAEAQALAASAAALIRELVEEDITDFERIPVPEPIPATAAPGRPEPAARDASRSPEPSTRAQAGSAPAAVSASGTPSGLPSPQASPQASQAPSAPEITEPTPWSDRQPTLEEVREHLGDCQRCGLCEGRSTLVFGDGNPNADLMFIGEGPGEQEDKTGLPFVGRAGELLTQMIEKGIGLSRADVYICNIVKCRPPRNRTPLPQEVSACRPFLDGQIRAVAPKVIITLGKPAASLLLDREVAITRLRGTWQDYQGIPLMPTLHPAYVLRQYTPENRRAVWQDLQAAVEKSRV